MRNRIMSISAFSRPPAKEMGMRNFFGSLAIAAFVLAAMGGLASADLGASGKGWVVHKTAHDFTKLVKTTGDAVKAHKMRVVTQASASAGAKGAGITIPGNRVMGVYRNDFARRMLDASIAAGIEAPIRYYVTENADGTATLAYKTPTAVFSPYFEEGGEALKALADELDTLFAAIAADAIK